MIFKYGLVLVVGFFAFNFIACDLMASSRAISQENGGKPRTVVKPALPSTINPQDLEFVRNLITEAQSATTFGDKEQLISSRLIGYPYLAKPLIGSLTEPEQMIIRFDGFDCVTYAETVLALAASSKAEEFPDKLREIRYEDGQVDYRRRLHYMTEWSKYQVQRGFFLDMTLGPDMLEKVVTLKAVPGIPAKKIRFNYFAKQEFGKISQGIENGDLICFVSTRKDLDVYHVGIIFRLGEKLLIRHARQQRGKVVEQPLAEFIRIIQAPGFIIYRPNL
jgi:Protein of unknown function (DUF1460)